MSLKINSSTVTSRRVVVSHDGLNKVPRWMQKIEQQMVCRDLLSDSPRTVELLSGQLYIIEISREKVRLLR